MTRSVSLITIFSMRLQIASANLWTSFCSSIPDNFTRGFLGASTSSAFYAGKLSFSLAMFSSLIYPYHSRGRGHLRKEKRHPDSECLSFVIGAPGGTRTRNPQIRSLVLYPVELRAHCSEEPCYYSPFSPVLQGKMRHSLMERMMLPVEVWISASPPSVDTGTRIVPVSLLA